MITLQALNNNHDSKKARERSASLNLELPTAMYIENRSNTSQLPIQGMRTKAAQLEITIMYRHQVKKHIRAFVYTYLNSQSLFTISLGMLCSSKRLEQDILGLDDESLHRLLSVLVLNLFDLSLFSSDQMFFINIGRGHKAEQGYQNIEPKWYFGKLSYINQLGNDEQNNRSLYYDGTNTLCFFSELQTIDHSR